MPDLQEGNPNPSTSRSTLQRVHAKAGPHEKGSAGRHSCSLQRGRLVSGRASPRDPAPKAQSRPISAEGDHHCTAAKPSRQGSLGSNPKLENTEARQSAASINLPKPGTHHQDSAEALPPNRGPTPSQSPSAACEHEICFRDTPRSDSLVRI